MNEDYLWDRSGPPDPFVEDLERTLAPLRFKAPRRTFPILRFAAAAAALIVTTLALWHLTLGATPWRDGANALGAGQVIRTGAAGAILESAGVGRVEVAPGSELRIESARKLWLNRGMLRAFIWAPPRAFVVDTPSAQAVDLGCAYTLQVGPRGDGLLRVEFGWVAFHFHGLESFIPAGAACVTRPRRGPGVPFYEDAPLRTSLSAYEKGEESALPALLRQARPQDGLTLWHLLTRVPPQQREAVWRRFRALVPVNVDTAAVLRQDPKALDACWDALKLENTTWWRGWERPWD